MLEIRLAGEVALLHPGGSLYLPRHRTLLVADAHFGKAVSFRRLGVPVPEATTAATLDALDAALADTGAGHVVFLGDFLHSARARAAATMAELRGWRESHGALQLTLVRGNHDARAGDPPADLRIDVVDEPLRLGAFDLCHHPRPREGAYVLAGHWHPCVRVRSRFDSLRLPCFWMGDDSGRDRSRAVGVLPAFGSFTGMHLIDVLAGDRIYAIADGTVRALPAIA